MATDSIPMPNPIYSSHEIKQIELGHETGPDTVPLMEKAGLAAAELAREILGEQQYSVLVLAGPGNNGGDALVAARCLRQWWYRVTVVFLGEQNKLPPDAAAAMTQWLNEGGDLLEDIPEDNPWDLVIDGLFGIGLERDLSGRYLELVKRINQSKLPVLAIDIPSGLDSDTGQPFRAAIRATHTLSFLALKPGLLTAYGPDYCGQIHLNTLGINTHALVPARGWLLERSLVADAIKPRPMNSHKGMLGSVGILGGAQSMVGAALLAGRAALKLGAGRVYLGLMDSKGPSVDLAQAELMLRTPGDLLAIDHLNSLIVGPGFGQSNEALDLLRKVANIEIPLILDADAINLLAEHPDIGDILRARNIPAIMTPHPAEAGRLLGTGTHDVQQDRLGSAQVIASRYNALVVLKGAGSICAFPDGTWFINSSGNPGMSSAGMGDILCGMIGAFIGQRLTPKQALLLAVYLHGAAADRLVERGVGPIGLTASEITEAARELINQWVY